MKMLRLSTADLVPFTLTRTKGSQAFENLSRYLQDNVFVELDISSAQPVSLSFLDEVVRKLTASQWANQVVFVTESEDIVQKLQQIAALRTMTACVFDDRKHHRIQFSPGLTTCPSANSWVAKGAHR